MGYWTYIMTNESTGQQQCGITEDVQHQLRAFNDPEYSGKDTDHFKGHWKLVWWVEKPTKTEADKLEKEIQKRGIAPFLAEQNRPHYNHGIAYKKRV